MTLSDDRHCKGIAQEVFFPPGRTGRRPSALAAKLKDKSPEEAERIRFEWGSREEQEQMIANRYCHGGLFHGKPCPDMEACREQSIEFSLTLGEGNIYHFNGVAGGMTGRQRYELNVERKAQQGAA